MITLFLTNDKVNISVHWLIRLPGQVTSSSVRLVSSTSRELRNEWKAPAGYSVNVATANATQVCFHPNSVYKCMPGLTCKGQM